MVDFVRSRLWLFSSFAAENGASDLNKILVIMGVLFRRRSLARHANPHHHPSQTFHRAIVGITYGVMSQREITNVVVSR